MTHATSVAPKAFSVNGSAITNDLNIKKSAKHSVFDLRDPARLSAGCGGNSDLNGFEYGSTTVDIGSIPAPIITTPSAERF